MTTAAGAAGTGLNIEDVFSIALYKGNGSSTKTVQTDIDYTNGGLLWIKNRDSSFYGHHQIQDTERGVGTGGLYHRLRLSLNSAEITNPTSYGISNLGTSSFTISGNDARYNNSTMQYLSYSFIKGKKFFDIVKYTGDGTAPRQISHNLGSRPGFIIFKRYDATANWFGWHRSLGQSAANAERTFLINGTDAAANGSAAFLRNVTDSYIEIGNNTDINASGGSYIMYIWAHNENGDGTHGETADQDIIHCGTYTGSGGVQNINFGFEPSWVLIRRTDAVGKGYIMDEMRGLMGRDDASDNRVWIYASSLEGTVNGVAFEPTGFRTKQNTSSDLNANGGTFIYVAIRKGRMATPTQRNSVYNKRPRNSAIQPFYDISYSDQFVTDFVIYRDLGSVTHNYFLSRKTGTYAVAPTTTSAEQNISDFEFDWNYGVSKGTSGGTNTNLVTWQFRQAPGFFATMRPSETPYNTLTLNHSLGVIPEMVWIKATDVSSDFYVYHKDVGGSNTLKLNSDAASSALNIVDSVSDTQIVLGMSEMGFTNDDVTIHLFASLAGISKVGSYTGNGSTTGQNIDCGFSAGTTFLLIKPESTTGNWHLFSQINTSGQDTIIRLNHTYAPATNADVIDYYASGFKVKEEGVYDLNTNGVDYVFYAIAV